jgi:hypothetical protein
MQLLDLTEQDEQSSSRSVLLLLVGWIARDVARTRPSGAQVFANAHELLNRDGRSHESADDLTFGLLDAARKRDLSVAREQGDAS